MFLNCDCFFASVIAWLASSFYGCIECYWFSWIKKNRQKTHKTSANLCNRCSDFFYKQQPRQYWIKKNKNDSFLIVPNLFFFFGRITWFLILRLRVWQFGFVFFLIFFFFLKNHLSKQIRQMPIKILLKSFQRFKTNCFNH